MPTPIKKDKYIPSKNIGTNKAGFLQVERQLQKQPNKVEAVLE